MGNIGVSVPKLYSSTLKSKSISEPLGMKLNFYGNYTFSMDLL